jgi:hypothetical protein
MSSYSDNKNKAQANYAKTAERLKRIQNQVSGGPRGGTLNGKICIVTGAGSMKGIGCVHVAGSTAHTLYVNIYLDLRRATALLWAREGNKLWDVHHGFLSRPY